MATRPKRVEMMIACRDADRPAARALLDSATGEPGFGAGSLHLEVDRGGKTWWVAHGVFTAAAAETIIAQADRVGAGLVVRTTRDERAGKTTDDPDPRTSMARAGVTVREIEPGKLDPRDPVKDVRTIKRVRK